MIRLALIALALTALLTADASARGCGRRHLFHRHDRGGAACAGGGCASGQCR